MPYIFLSFIPYVVFLFIIIGIMAYFNNRNSNNMDQQTQIKPKGSAKDFFLNLGAIVVLYTVVVSLVNLLFIVINVAYPQITSGYNYYGSQSISWPVSILIIAFPILIVLMWQLEKIYLDEPQSRMTGVHKWLSYITLFLAGITSAVDLITVLYYYLDGQELTTGFLLKVLVVFVVAIGLFIYYISDARGRLTSGGRKVWRLVSTSIIIGSIVWGFSVLGSPRSQRLIKYDEQKINDLQNINGLITNYWQLQKTVPSSLEESKNVLNNSYYIEPVDPQSQKPYEYKKTSSTTYELCATFNKASNDKTNLRARPYIDTPYPYGSMWSHPAGHYCFFQNINQQNNKGSNIPVPVMPL